MGATRTCRATFSAKASPTSPLASSAASRPAGSVSGTALILSAGGRSRWANIFVGLFVAAIVLLAAPLVELVPMPALAALLIVAGYQGLRVPEAVIAWKTGRISRVVMLVTFIATLVVPLQFAVLFGVALSVVLHVFRQSNKVVVTQWVLQPQGFPLEQPAPRRLPSHQPTLLYVSSAACSLPRPRTWRRCCPRSAAPRTRCWPSTCAARARSAAPSSPCCNATPWRCARTTAS